MAIHAPFAGMEARRPRPRTTIGGLFLAGDWVRTGLPSSMESAVGAGWMVTEEILAEEGRHRTLFTPPAPPEGLSHMLRATGKILPFWRIPKWMPHQKPAAVGDGRLHTVDRLVKAGFGKLFAVAGSQDAPAGSGPAVGAP